MINKKLVVSRLVCMVGLGWSGHAIAGPNVVDGANIAAKDVKHTTRKEWMSDSRHLKAHKAAKSLTPRTAKRNNAAVLRWDASIYVPAEKTGRPIAPSVRTDPHALGGDTFTWRTNRAIEFAVRSNSNDVSNHAQAAELDNALITNRTDVGVLGSVKWKF